MKDSPPTKAVLVRRYLEHRRSFGYELKVAEIHLNGFARFMDRKAPRQPVTVKLALEWARGHGRQPVTVAQRLSVVRGFARFCTIFDARTQIPPNLLERCRSRRRAPHIFTKSQLRQILQRATGLRPYCTDLRPATYHTLIGLLACSGLRPSEVLRLRDSDFNAAGASLAVPAVKCGPGRQIPLHSSTVRALQRYQRLRRSRFPWASHFFVGPLGKALQIGTVDETFQRLVHGIECNGCRPHPRLYDFRHTFTTRTIARWSKQKEPLSHHLVLLSRYLGHKDFHQTYWYVEHDLHALEAASARFEQFRK